MNETVSWLWDELQMTTGCRDQKHKQIIESKEKE